MARIYLLLIELNDSGTAHAVFYRYCFILDEGRGVRL